MHKHQPTALAAAYNKALARIFLFKQTSFGRLRLVCLKRLWCDTNN